MNLREGTRRLALFLGVTGAIFGGLVSYFQLQSTMRQRVEHKQFEQAAMRIEQLGKKVQEEYPVYKDMDPGDIGWRVLVKYPQFWSWVSGQAAQQPELPKPWEMYQAEHAQQSEPQEDADYNWRVLGINPPGDRTLYPAPAPSRGTYLLIAVLPALGFFVPWGVVRAVGWVIVGFAASPK